MIWNFLAEKSPQGDHQGFLLLAQQLVLFFKMANLCVLQQTLKFMVIIIIHDHQHKNHNSSKPSSIKKNHHYHKKIPGSSSPPVLPQVVPVFSTVLATHAPDHIITITTTIIIIITTITTITMITITIKKIYPYRLLKGVTDGSTCLKSSAPGSSWSLMIINLS